MNYNEIIIHNKLLDWLVDWCFNGTSTQKGQFVPTAGEPAGEGKTAQSAEDGRDTTHNTEEWNYTW